MSRPKPRRTGRTKSKAAQATAERRAADGQAHAAAAPEPSEAFRARSGDDGPVEAVEFKGGGGTLMRMRGGFQELAGQGEARKPSWTGRLIWIALLAAIGFFVFGQSR
ncbi:MAG: hypothetical protein KC613_08090 [Myxococcales bacterium]|nr:hypothetical protein [Myxococcales bacterium]